MFIKAIMILMLFLSCVSGIIMGNSKLQDISIEGLFIYILFTFALYFISICLYNENKKGIIILGFPIISFSITMIISIFIKDYGFLFLLIFLSLLSYFYKVKKSLVI